jgi:hypothetical protein
LILLLILHLFLQQLSLSILGLALILNLHVLLFVYLPQFLRKAILFGYFSNLKLCVFLLPPCARLSISISTLIQGFLVSGFFDIVLFKGVFCIDICRDGEKGIDKKRSGLIVLLSRLIYEGKSVKDEGVDLFHVAHGFHI